MPVVEVLRRHGFSTDPTSRAAAAADEDETGRVLMTEEARDAATRGEDGSDWQDGRMAAREDWRKDGSRSSKNWQQQQSQSELVGEEEEGQQGSKGSGHQAPPPPPWPHQQQPSGTVLLPDPPSSSLVHDRRRSWPQVKDMDMDIGEGAEAAAAPPLWQELEAGGAGSTCYGLDGQEEEEQEELLARGSRRSKGGRPYHHYHQHTRPWSASQPASRAP